MSKSFQIFSGDLVLQNRTFATVNGQDKLFQDLTLTLEEPLGTDPLAPTFGSSLDGEIINGREISPFIGQVVNPSILSAISSEVQRVVSQYQQSQLQKMKNEGLIYQGRTTLDKSEIIYSINSVQTTNIGTIAICRVSLTTLAGQDINLTVPINI